MATETTAPATRLLTACPDACVRFLTHADSTLVFTPEPARAAPPVLALAACTTRRPRGPFEPDAHERPDPTLPALPTPTPTPRPSVPRATPSLTQP